MPRKKKAQKPVAPVDESPDVANEEAAVTIKNVDPAFMYSIDVAPNVRGFGFVVRVSHDPDTKEWLTPDTERRRFFVCRPGAEYNQFTMPLDEAMGKNFQKEARLTKEDLDMWTAWMAVHYVKTS